MTLRERLLLMGGAAVVLHMAWSFLFWEPLLKQEQRLRNELAGVQEESREIEQNLVELGQKFGIDYNAKTESMIEELLKEMEALESRSGELTALLVAPDEMARLLEQLLLDRGGLRLVKLENSVSEAANEESEAPQSAEEQKVDAVVKPPLPTGIYKHGFVLELEGDFFSILEYLQALESQPRRFFWDAVEYDVGEYPQAKVRIRLHTLSLSEGWVGV
jgi:MSHA biogenesis protein MshJ